MKWAFIFIFFVANLVKAQDNKELQQMADADQQSRIAPDINWIILNEQDSIRRVRVDEFFEKGEIRTAKDYLNAGIIFQHGNDTIASQKAVNCFGKAIELDSTLNRWWCAAAVDRDLMRRGEPQIYGTQFIKNKMTNEKWKRYTIDTTKISDKERKYYSVETLAQQREKERLMNSKSISSLAGEKSIDEVVELIKSEFEKGSQSEYNVTESAINSLGYVLMNDNRDKEALQIFKLNTVLYPDQFNTYDSYGECLLKLNHTKQGLKAYRKSLELNPDNENARKILGEFENTK